MLALAPAQRRLQRSAFTRHTVDEDPEVLPGIWLDQRCGVWHDLRLVHQSMFARGVEKVGVCGVRNLLEEDGSGCFTLSAARRAPRTSACCPVADSRGVAIRGVEVGVS